MFDNFASSRLTCFVLTKDHIQTLKASRAVQNKIYRYHIGPRYVQHFKHIIFDESSDLIGLDYLAASLASFTSLKELTLNASSAKATFGSDRRFLSSSSHATKMVKRINTKIRTLHLNDFPVVDALGYLDLFKSLNEVTIRGPPPTPTEEVAKFATVLRNVEELTLIIHRVPYHLPPSFSETSHEWPKLRSLALNIDLIDQTTISFIQHFRSSLEELTVTTLNDPEDARDSLTIPDEATFPHLRRISLIGTNLAARTVFRDTTSRTFPALDYVRLSYVNYNASGFGHDDENLDSLFERHRFRFLQYDPPDQVFRLEDAEHVQELADDHNVQLYLRDYPSKTSSAFLSEEETPDQIRFQESIGKDLTFTQSRIEEDLERIKDYLETTMAKASESEDVSALYRLLEFLRPLELERFAMLD